MKKILENLILKSEQYYGNAIGLAPIRLSNSINTLKINKKDFWSEYCTYNPSKVNCLNYDC